MKTKSLKNAAVLIFETGDEVVSSLTAFAEQEKIYAGRFTAIGAFRDVALGYYVWEKKQYLRIPVDEQVEVVSLLGDISVDEEGTAKVHAHVVVAMRDGRAMGGHLLEAHVRPTLELVLDTTAAQLKRKFDPESGIALIDLTL